MQLLYLYIKDYRKFKHQNLNFGSEYIFNYSEEEKILDVKKNELFIVNHYEKENNSNAKLLSITSIIGQNGTGKTSILNFVKDNFVSGLNLNKPCIFITKEDGKIIVYHTEEFKLEKNIEFEFVYKKLNLKKEKLEFDGANENDFISFGYNFKGFKNTDFIFFSNVFDFPGGSSLKGIYDISTNNLIINDFKSEIENKQLINYEKTNQLISFINNDLNRQIKFIKRYFNSDKIPFKLPEILIISIKNDFFSNDFNFDYFKNYTLFSDLKKFIKNAELESIKLKNEIERFRYKFIINVYLNFLVDILFSYQGLDKLFNINKVNFLDSNKIIDIKYLIKKIESINFLKNQIFSNNQTSSKRFESIVNLINLINQIELNNSNNNDYYFENYGLIFKINHNTIEDFKKFMDNYEASVIIRPFLNFHWDNISSGEKALLNFYSRFYSLSDNQKFANGLNKHLVILIDEGDLYLHPEWQKRFVKILIDFLPVIFESKSLNLRRTIQIIFTTNSPIPASDLLSYNTIFLEKFTNEKGENLTIVKDSLNDQKETFAANIHTLLSDSFFVKGGLIGDFASEKLNEIIDKLIKRIDLSKEERENMRKLIHQVGEPVLKTKLIQMYNDRFNLDIHERLDNIEKELGI